MDDFRSAVLSSALVPGIGDGEEDGWQTDREERERPKPEIILNAAAGFGGIAWPEVGMDEVRPTPGRGDAVTNETSEGTMGVFAGREDVFAPSWERWNTLALPFSANCAYDRSCDRRSQVGAASVAHFECAMRLQ